MDSNPMCGSWHNYILSWYAVQVKEPGPLKIAVTPETDVFLHITCGLLAVRDCRGAEAGLGQRTVKEELCFWIGAANTVILKASTTGATMLRARWSSTCR